jgi:hypothetical protein
MQPAVKTAGVNRGVFDPLMTSRILQSEGEVAPLSISGYRVSPKKARRAASSGTSPSGP